MAFGYKILGQAAPADTNNADLYTVPSATEAIVSSIAVANVTATAATYRIYIRDGQGCFRCSEHHNYYRDRHHAIRH